MFLTKRTCSGTVRGHLATVLNDEVIQSFCTAAILFGCRRQSNSLRLSCLHHQGHSFLGGGVSAGLPPDSTFVHRGLGLPAFQSHKQALGLHQNLSFLCLVLQLPSPDHCRRGAEFRFSPGWSRPSKTKTVLSSNPRKSFLPSVSRRAFAPHYRDGSRRNLAGSVANAVFKTVGCQPSGKT